MNESQNPLPPATTNNISPKWGNSTKMVVALTITALIAILVFYFRQILGPALLAFILAFLLHPLIAKLSTSVRQLSWRTAVSLTYLILVIILGLVLAASGFALVTQVQSLFEFVNRFITGLPALVADLSSRSFQFGPFQLNLAQFDLTALAEQVINILRPMLGQAGTLISKFATGAASAAGWGFFVLLVSYYLLAEGGQIRENLVHIAIPGYSEDMRRLARELSNKWAAFLRGQLIISLLTVLVYSLVLTVLGLRFTLAIALMAGLARFVPYVGPWATWITTALVALLQPGNYFGLEAWKYTIIILVVCITLDWIFDNLIVPRLMGETLGVHPAGVLVAAILAANLIGIVGLVLAAPVLATVNLVGKYVGRKLFDLDPWPEPERPPNLPRIPGIRVANRLRAWWRLRKKP